MAYEKNPKSVYAEKLRDPRWQKKRLEIMQRDNFTCVLCAEKEITLNVHHCFYEYGKDPWDYPDKSLLTLCEDCHENEESTREAPKDFLLFLKQNGFVNTDVDYIFYLFHTMLSIGVTKKDLLRSITILCREIEKDFTTKSVGGTTNSTDLEEPPTGEGLCERGTVERKSDA